MSFFPCRAVNLYETAVLTESAVAGDLAETDPQQAAVRIADRTSGETRTNGLRELPARHRSHYITAELI